MERDLPSHMSIISVLFLPLFIVKRCISNGPLSLSIQKSHRGAQKESKPQNEVSCERAFRAAWVSDWSLRSTTLQALEKKSHFPAFVDQGCLVLKSVKRLVLLDNNAINEVEVFFISVFAHTSGLQAATKQPACLI